MKTTGTYIVTLTEATDQYHQPGTWLISRDIKVVAVPDLHDEYDADVIKASVLRKLEAVKVGDIIAGASESGKTGFTGEITAITGEELTIKGEAYGASHAFYDGWQTHTFTIRNVNAFYCGSLKELSGMRADQELVERICQLIN